MEERAEKLVRSFLTSTGAFIHPRDVRERVVAFVRAEAAAERERCARVAEGWRRPFADQFTRLEAEAAQAIAAAIREGREP